MSDRQAFLDAIRHAPDEDAPRLIYADWLDDNGESERAALIRFQCALGPRCDPAHTPFDAGAARRVGLRVGAGLVAWNGFDRGFVAGVMGCGRAALDDARELLATEAVRTWTFNHAPDVSHADWAGVARQIFGVKLVNAGPVDLGPFADCREVELEEMYDPPDFGDPWPMPFRNVRRLRTRSLGLARLASAMRACGPELRSLDVEVPMDQAIADDLPPEVPLPPALESLKVRRRGRPIALANLMARFADVPLTSLELEGESSETNVGRLLSGWPGAARLERLSLVGMRLEPGELRLLADAMPSLRSLRLALSLDSPIFETPGWPRIEEVELSSGLMSETLLKEFARGLARLRYYLPCPTLAPVLDRLDSVGGGALRELRIRRHHWDSVKRLSRSLPGLEVLDLSDSWGEDLKRCRGLTLDRIQALGRAPFAGNLRALALGHGPAAKLVNRAAIDLFGSRCDVYWYEGAAT